MLKLSDLEIEVLRKLVNGEEASISSQQRVRLELAGMVREGAGYRGRLEILSFRLAAPSANALAQPLLSDDQNLRLGQRATSTAAQAPSVRPKSFCLRPQRHRACDLLR
jgi:hypothetical protein